MTPARVAILLSGRGSNFVALHRAIAEGSVPAEVVAVVSDKEDAAGLARARELGLHAVAVTRRGLLTREAHEARVLDVLRRAEAEWICLAGYMRLLSASFVSSFPRRILNIHPSLLPSFPGLQAQAKALEHGVKISGCTVHLVDEGLDSGPIVLQEAVPVLPGDDEDQLSARILAAEHRCYPEALRLVLSQPWRVEGRRFLLEDRPQKPAL